MAKKRILFVGTACVCFRAETPYIPAPGETLTSSGDYDWSPGGHGLLSAAASRRLGGDPALCSCVGRDYFGDRLREICKAEQIHASNLASIPETRTGLQLRLSEKDGTKRTVWLPGAAGSFTREQIDNAFCCYPDGVVASSACPPEILAQASALAASREVPFFLDEDPEGPAISELPPESVKKAELFFVGETRASDRRAASVGSEERQKSMCYSLYKGANVRSIVMRLGSKGCFLYDGKYFSLVSSPESEPVDPEGAAAAFTAAFVGEYLVTKDLLRASQYANAASVLTASRPGGFSALPKKDEL